MDAAFAQVAHSAQDDAVGEATRPEVVAGSQLVQYGKERVAHQRVDFVDQQHERPRIGGRPADQNLQQSPGGVIFLQDLRPDVAHALVR